MTGITKKYLQRLIAILIVLIFIAAPEALFVRAEDDNSKDENVATEVDETEDGRIPVDENGLDSDGRMIAYYGSPVIEGEIDDVWDIAEEVTPLHVPDEIETTATFKALWDDHSLYVMAKVIDSDLSVESGNTYEQDSVEIFLDENNDKISTFGPDDVHFRVNYENVRSSDQGNIASFFANAIVEDGGYTIVLRVPLHDKYSNGDVFGIELQANDASGPTRLGTINVFDGSGTAWQDPSVFGEIVLAGKTDESESGVNPYSLLSLINRNRELNTAVYKNTEIVEEAIVQIEEELEGKSLSQEEIDGLYDQLSNTISQLELTEEAANDKIFQPLPDEYRALNEDQPGSIETLEYTAENPEGETDDKKLHVYLPYGYDASDTDTKYNVFYLMHGGGESEDFLFGGQGEERELKRILDNMIAKSDIDPLIVVTPTNNSGKGVELFAEKLVDDVIPLVETKYNTFVETADLDEIIATREHRAFGGFSRGSRTTWNVFVNGLDYVKYFMPLAGGPEASAEELADVVREEGYTPEEYYIFAANGVLDFTFDGMQASMEDMKEIEDVFIYSSDLEQGNFYFMISEEGSHGWTWANQYVYNMLPDMFR